MNGSQEFFAKYELLNQIGTGAFSEVRVGVERCSGIHYAVKIIDRQKCKGKEDMIETEVSILKKIRHPNIIQLFEIYEFDNKIYLVMELVNGGELFDEIVGRGTFYERDAAKVVQKILLAIEYLHSQGIVHRDLKPENLLLSDKGKAPQVKISDFGLSKIFNTDQFMKTACGTPGYVAPEVLKRQGYGPEVDLWSLGVITYILLCGYPPFFDKNNNELFKKIMSGRFQFDRPWWDNVSEKAKDFIKKLLVLDTGARMTATTALAHPFIVDYCGVEKRADIRLEIRLPRVIEDNSLEARRMQENITAPIPRPIGQKQYIDDSESTVHSNQHIAKSSDKHKSSRIFNKIPRITSWFKKSTK